MGGEGREDPREDFERMFGTDMHITCGDLMPMYLIRDTMNLTRRQKSAES